MNVSIESTNKDSELLLTDFLYELMNTQLTLQAPLGL